MKLVNIKCPNCGSTVKVEEYKKKVHCEYCESDFLLEDENTINVKHFHAGEITEEQEFINAKTNLDKLKNYDEAYKIYLSLSKRYVDNAEIWIGLLRSLTCDFTYKYATVEFKKLHEKYWKNFVALASEKEIAKYEKKYNNYLENVNAKSDVNNSGVVKKESCYLLLTVFLGIFGVHKFVQKKPVWGFLYLFTFGLFCVGWIKDIISEYRKWPETSQKQVVKWLIFGLFMILAITELSYSFFAAVLYFLAAITSIDYLWKEFNIKNIALRICVPFGLFLLASEIGSQTIPESAYGTWFSQDGGSYSVIEFSSDDVKLYKKQDDKKYIEGTSSYYKSYIYVDIYSGDELVFSYDATKDELCLLDKNNKCIIEYEYLDNEDDNS